MTRKNKYYVSIIVAAMTFIIASQIFSDWDSFKKGLTGEPEIKKLESHTSVRGTTYPKKLNEWLKLSGNLSLRW